MINILQLTTHNYSKGLIALSLFFSFRLPFAGISKLNERKAIFCSVLSVTDIHPNYKNLDF